MRMKISFSKKGFFAIFLCILVTTISYSTDKNLNKIDPYFPMKLGNKWIFQQNELPPWNTFITLSVEDTLRFENELYYKIAPLLFKSPEYYRIDSLGNFLSLDDDRPVLNLNMAVGDSIQIADYPEFSDSGYTYCVDKKIVETFVGSRGEQIEFFLDWYLRVIDEAQTLILQEGVGPVGLSYTEHDLPMILRGAVLNGIVYGDTTTTSAKENNSENVNTFYLSQNYPNPFNSCTMVHYAVDDPGKIKLSIYDIRGEEVMTVVDGFQDAGSHEIALNMDRFSSGTYLYKLISPKGFITKSMSLVK